MAFTKKVRGRGFCKNCRKKYDKIHPDQRYCTRDCKRQFEKAGGLAIGSYARTIRLEVERQLVERMATLEQRIINVLTKQERTELADRIKAAIDQALKP